MPDTDFDQIAEAILTDGNERCVERAAETDWPAALVTIVEQLRQVWNARGAADIAAMKRDILGTCEDTRHSDPDNSGLCITCGVVLDYMDPSERTEQLDRTIRRLDR